MRQVRAGRGRRGARPHARRRHQLAREVAGGPTPQVRQLDRVVVDESASHHPAVRVDQVDRVPRDEAARHVGDPRGKQRGAPLGQRAHRPEVDHDATLGLGGVRQPEQSGRSSAAGGVEQRAGLGALQRCPGAAHAREHDRDAGARGDAGCLELGLHPARAHARLGRAADLDPVELVHRPHLGDQPGRRLRGRSVVEPVHVGEQDEQVGVHEVRHQGGEPVVVPEPDLRGGHGVVLVDDRDDAELEQLVEGALRVAVMATSSDVVDGQQHLSGHLSVPGELLGVAVHQQSLPDRCGSLLTREVARTTLEGERRQARGDGARGDQHEVRAPSPDTGQAVDERTDLARVDHAGGRGQRGRADLDHDPLGCGHGRPVAHSSSSSNAPRSSSTYAAP